MVPGAYDIQQVDITLPRRVHEHDADRRLPRRGQARGDAHDRADDGPARRRARHRSGRGAAAELHQGVPVRVGDRAQLRLGQLRGRARQGARAGRLRRASRRGARRRAARGNHRGIGLSTWVEICGLAPSAVTHAIGIGSGGWESSIVRLHPTGTATVITGSSAHGQGHATSWSQIVESELGIPFADIDVIHGDTLYSPYGIGTFGSRSLAVGGIALQQSCVKVRDKARLLAAHMLECSADDLEWADGKWSVKGSPERVEDDPGARRRGLDGQLAARGHGAEPRRDDVLRSAELHVPVRHAHRRGRDRRRDRARSRSSATPRSTTAATSSTR